MPDLTRLYLDTVKALILNDIYPEAEAERAYLIKCVEGVERFDARAFYSGAVGDPETMRAFGSNSWPAWCRLIFWSPKVSARRPPAKVSTPMPSTRV